MNLIKSRNNRLFSSNGLRFFSKTTLSQEFADLKSLVAQQQVMLEKILNVIDSSSSSTVRRNPIEEKPVPLNYLDPPREVLQKNPRGFEDFERKAEPYRPPKFRVRGWAEINQEDVPVSALQLQAARCMDCGTPFCQTYTGCPINNLIPEWNSLVLQEQWKEAYHRLSETNNFPEFTGRVCPAPCEGACVAGIYSEKEAVTIKNIEYRIIDTAFKRGWVKPRLIPDIKRSSKSVAIIGSGPAGLACADQLNQLGHNVTVFERSSVIGGLMHYGIPNMKIDKGQVARRISLLEKEGITFVTNSEVGKNISVESIEKKFDSVCLAIGATVPRNLEVPGSNATGVLFAMDFLTANQVALDENKDVPETYSAEAKNVIVIGGGDTGTDCISTSLRNYCKSLINLELTERLPDQRNQDSGYWPLYPRVYKMDYGHEEAKEIFGDDPRQFSIKTLEIIEDNNKVTGVKTVLVDAKGNHVKDSEKVIPADLVLLAMGFTGPEENLYTKLGIKSVSSEIHSKYRTSKPSIFTAGDCRRGQSLVVWAINEGREAADVIDEYLREEIKDNQKLQRI